MLFVLYALPLFLLLLYDNKPSVENAKGDFVLSFFDALANVE